MRFRSSFQARELLEKHSVGENILRLETIGHFSRAGDFSSGYIGFGVLQDAAAPVCADNKGQSGSQHYSKFSLNGICKGHHIILMSRERGPCDDCYKYHLERIYCMLVCLSISQDDIIVIMSQ